MITVEMKRMYTDEELQAGWRPGTYINDPYGAVRQMIFEEMIMHKLPLKITLNSEEEPTNEEEI